VFGQPYTALSSIEVKETVMTLEEDIKYIKLKLLTQTDPVLVLNLQDKGHELRSFLQVRVKGALVRSHFATLKDMDAPSAFFKPWAIDIAMQTDDLPSYP
jgi:hypothetical protein